MVEYTLSDENEMEIQEALNDENNPIERIEMLADIVEDIIGEEEYSKSTIKTICYSFGTHDVVGTGLGSMNLSQVFHHLGDFAEYDEDFDIPQHGGDEDLIAQLSKGPSEITHSVYYALEELYSKKLFDEICQRRQI